MDDRRILKKPSSSRTPKTRKFKPPVPIAKRLSALALASVTALGGFQVLVGATPVQASTYSEKYYTIGTANDGAKITIDGKNYIIDRNSFVIDSEEQDGDLAYDVHGNFLKGHIDPTDYTPVMKMTEEQMSHYDIRQVISNAPANVRSSGEIRDDNKISTVLSGDYVLASDEITSENDKEWLPTISINDGVLYQGYMREDVIREIDSFEELNDRSDENIENMMYVDTSSDNYIPLNLRTSPTTGSSDNIITKIPYGSIIENLGIVEKDGNRNWVAIRYTTPEGSSYDGWIVENYLSQEMVPEKPTLEEVQYSTNASGNITGIDVSKMSANDLRNLLQGQIPKTVDTAHGSFDSSQLAGDINYVYMKIGASTYNKGDITPLPYDNYIEQVQVCEELGVPYGFYYYSTAITVEEAELELACIQERLENLREQYDLKCNKLEIAVDFELSGANDRQYKGNIKEKTEAKAALINGLLQQGLCKDVLIYGPSRVMKSSQADQIIDLEYLHSKLDNPDAVKMWLCSLQRQNGDMKKDLEADIAYIESQGFSTVAVQAILDAKVIGHIDINNMDLDHFAKLTTQEKTQSNDYER